MGTTIAMLVFGCSLAMLGGVYFLFPGILACLALIRKSPVKKKEIYPSVSLIVCAFNEQHHIVKKIHNCLSFNYPREKLEIIVVSDGSTDKTNEILKGMDDPMIRTIIMPERQGKTACQNRAVEYARYEVLFFTDATIMHPADALRLLVRSLNDPTVGCVTGRPVFNRDKGGVSKGLNKRESYELYLRGRLGEVNSLFGAQDCIYAVPKKLYPMIPPDLDSGFVGPLKILEAGYRTVYEPQALALVDRPVPKIADEFIRRSRIVLRGMRGLLHMKHLMNPFKFGFLAISLIFTRFLRWLTPVFLIMMLAANVFLLSSKVFLVLFILQVSFYSVAFGGYVLEKKGRSLGALFHIPLYFCLVSCSAASGLKRLLTGDTGQLWQTRR